MTIIKEYNTGTSQWEPVVVGQQGNTGYTGSQGITGYTGSVAPIGGSDSYVQYNNGGALGGNVNFVFDDVNSRVGIGTASPANTLHVVGTMISNGTITLEKDYTETISSSTGSTTINLSNGTIFIVTTNGSNTITLPSSVSGKSFVVAIDFGGTHTVTWAGGTSIEWPGGTAPSLTSESGKIDVISFFQDGTRTIGVPAALDVS